MSCDEGEVIERMENELQPFHHFTYVTTYSLTLLSLYLHHSSFSNLSVASPTSQFILQPFTSPTSQALHLIHLVSCPCVTVLYSTELTLNNVHTVQLRKIQTFSVVHDLSASSKALGYRLDGLGVRGVGIFLRSFVSRSWGPFSLL